jgi:hypothetical protein
VPDQKFTGLADDLDACPREGAATDAPEGARYIKLSDTLARQIAAALRRKEPLVKRCAVCGRIEASIENWPAAFVCEDCSSK